MEEGKATGSLEKSGDGAHIFAECAVVFQSEGKGNRNGEVESITYREPVEFVDAIRLYLVTDTEPEAEYKSKADREMNVTKVPPARREAPRLVARKWQIVQYHCRPTSPATPSPVEN